MDFSCDFYNGGPKNMGKKTRDGLSLADILKAAMQAGIGIREGGKHPYALEYPNMRPCPIATSTDAKRMVVPWIAEAIGRGRSEIYTALRQGYWSS
jgi:hypothetical protein